MADGHQRAMLAFVLAQTLLLGLLAVQVARGFVGSAGAFTGLSPVLRLALLLVVLTEILVPLAVYVDVARRTDDPDWVWVHAATMPVVNLLGLLAYLDDRKRSRE
ncbi:hypothetical protein [Haloarcula onubensis]|uniref:Cardiolipin synthase N-terminal domain-containing protein n=1 Tax=Haloarcula onubensis TaxID=2950539 RepID=A0ABU2FKB5_9EURY|nr:hypothetical protein [Halomicroarcula sp. S3CR25-11]MDS0281200.1 hypothetical protein [Halomicroarcula sp. S3CR25-11]